jgi:hypothetical protein
MTDDLDSLRRARVATDAFTAGTQANTIEYRHLRHLHITDLRSHCLLCAVNNRSGSRTTTLALPGPLGMLAPGYSSCCCLTKASCTGLVLIP